ncbi:MAG: EndoU domain-containing protein [Alphaproteobacteria bacterium]|nr:EndoU domain-containing protein [Alphaproteobacteria bacterium]
MVCTAAMIRSLALATLVLASTSHVALADLSCPRDRTGPVLSKSEPPIDVRHIFCGEVSDGRAKGYHARPGGFDPGGIDTSVAETGDGPYAGTYTLRGFEISDGGVTAEKGLSTMFPDTCSRREVLRAILHAYRTGERTEGRFEGSGGAHCTATDGAPIGILGFTHTAPRFHIRTAFPN